MRRCVASVFLVACTDHTPPDPGIAITIATTSPPSAIAVRDGLDGEWRTPTTVTSSSYTYGVHGPYSASVVCTDAFGAVTTHQVSRTPDDDRALAMPCPIVGGPVA